MEIYEEQLTNFVRAMVLSIAAIISFISMYLAVGSGVAYAAEAVQPKVEVTYFWGRECPHCANLKPWLDNFEKEHLDTLKITRYEFWHNKDNAQLFMNTMQAYGVPEKSAGAPAIVVNNKVLIGTNIIEQDFEKEYNEALEKLKSKNVSSESILIGGENMGAKLNEAATSKDIGAITATALADSVNPCAMAVLVILLSSLVVMQSNKAKIAMTAFAFVLASYITYFIVGLGLTQAITFTGVSEKIIIAVGAVSIIVGLAELKDAFFYHRGGWSTEIPAKWRGKLSKLILSVTSPKGAFIVGMAVTMFELPCTGGPYLFGLSLISQYSDVMRILLLTYYNIIFILPLICISLLIILSSKSVERINVIEHFRNTHVKEMHFVVGIIMLSMGIWALFIR